MRTQEEIEEQIELAYNHNGSRPSRTYEEGVRAALDWVIEENDEAPINV